MQFTDQASRSRLNREFHSRPPIPLHGSAMVTHVACLRDQGQDERERGHFQVLASALGASIEQPAPELAILYSDKRCVRWERHTEFSSYTFFHMEITDAAPFWQQAPMAGVPAGWLDNLPGEMLVACCIEMRRQAVDDEAALISQFAGDGRQMVVSRAVDGAAWIAADFLFGGDSPWGDAFSRFVLINDGMTPRQAGRTVQRLIEIETYRLFALLGLPVARELGQWIRGAESTLADLTGRIEAANGLKDEHAVLNTLSALSAEVERIHATTGFRFGASEAYHALVRQRIGELREERVPGFPTFSEFMERRLTPPMATCQSMRARLKQLSSGLARSSALLRARVDVGLEQQNQALLQQMNQRNKLQFQLQETVEGLSVIAMTYYGSQLVHHMAAGMEAKGWHVSPEVAAAVAVPLIAGMLYWRLRVQRTRLHRALVKGD
ncbi:DUF3422 domain-containing protein [Burkholderiaceae bacterium DAT-1]|nr:DUF3422 domain-containing protein [Burkholderiaceae bacterium DAT-1]